MWGLGGVPEETALMGSPGYCQPPISLALGPRVTQRGLFRSGHVERRGCQQCPGPAGEEEEEEEGPSAAEGQEASDQEGAESAAENLGTEGEKEPGTSIPRGVCVNPALQPGERCRGGGPSPKMPDMGRE